MAIIKTIEIKVNEQGTKEAKQSMDGLNQSTNENTQATTQNEQAQKNLKQQYREAVVDLQKLSDQYGLNSKEAINAAKRAADLKDRIEDTNDAMLAFKGEGTFIATSKALSSVTSGVGALEGAMNLVGNESEDVQKAILKLQSLMALSQGLEGLEDAGRSFNQLKIAIGNTALVQKASNLVTKTATAIQYAFTGAVATTTTGFKALRFAIASAGIGALVVGVGLLIANFDKFKPIINTFVANLQGLFSVVKLVFKNIGGVFSQFKTTFIATLKDIPMAFVNTFKGIGSVIKAIVTGEFASVPDLLKDLGKNILKTNPLTGIGVQIAENGFGDMGNQISKEFEKAKKLALKGSKELKSETQNNIVSESFSSQSSSDSGSKEIETEKKTNDELLKLREDYAKKLEDQRIKTEEEKIKAERQAAQDELNRLGGDLESQLQLNAYYDKLMQDAKDQRETEQLEKDLEKKEQESENEQLTFDERLAKIQEREQLINDNKILLGDKYLDVLKENADKENEINKQKAEYEKQQRQDVANASLETAGQTLNLVGQLAKSGSKLGKAIAVADVIRGGIQGTMNAYQTAQKSPITTLFPGYPIVQAGLAAAFAGVQLSKINSTSETATSGGSSSGGSTPTPPPAPSFNLVQGTGTNQIAEGLARSNNPVKAYVVASEVTTQQSLERNIQTNASIGTP